jgi:hypothetical protein
MRHWGSAEAKVGVVGLGGLGHMGVKFARALGAHVVVFWADVHLGPECDWHSCTVRAKNPSLPLRAVTQRTS